LDLLGQFVYFGEQASVDLAEWYLAAVEQTCLQLATNPQWETCTSAASPG
jgi:hypothetical protein